MKRIFTITLLCLLSIASTWAQDILMQSGSITLESGTVTNFYDTGGADGNYTNNEDYTLTVQAPEGKSVQVSFTNFATEYDYDSLYIYNGTSTDAPLLAELNGELSETKTYTATNADGALTFVFYSDGSTNEAGWEATLTTIDMPTAYYTLSFSNDKGDAPAGKTVYANYLIGKLPELAMDGYTFIGWEIDDVQITNETIYGYGDNKTATAVWKEGYRMQNGTITLESETVTNFYDTGGADGRYTLDEDYTLTVKAPENKLVQVSFTNFYTESSHDSLYIYNGTSTGAPLLAALHGEFSETKTYIATNADGALTFVFKSDYNVEDAGWEATLTTIDAPTAYTLSFSNEKGDAPDAITVYDGLNIGELPEVADVDGYTFLGWYIDNVLITDETIYSYGSDKTATAVWEEGYRMQDGTITLESGTVTNFYDTGGADGNYTNNENNTLTVQAPEGKLVQVSFTNFYTESDYDSLYIYNGTSTDAPLLAELNGVLSETTYTATNSDGALTFVFYSDDSETYPGWEAMLTTIEKPTAYTLSFSNDKGETPDATTVYDGLNIGVLPELSMDGYILIGWYIDNVQITKETLWNYTEDKTAVAQWIKVILMCTDTITITDSILFLDDNGYDDYNSFTDYTLTLLPADDNSTVKIDIKSYDAYHTLYMYNGSSTNSALLAKVSGEHSDLSYQSTNVNGALTLVFYSDEESDGAGWEAMLSCQTLDNANKLSFDLSYADTTNIDTIYVQKDKEIGGLPTPEREGYIFAGWQIDGSPITNASIWTYTEDKTATAQWITVTMLSYTLTDSILTLTVDENGEEFTSILSNIDDNDAVRKLVITNPGIGETIMPQTDFNELFYGWENLDTIVGLEYINTQYVTDMNSMFQDCYDLKSLDLSKFNTENVTDMEYMFYDCNELESLDLSSFNTENVTDMGDMFYDCESLESLDLSNFNTENVTDMSDMFHDCEKLEALDLSKFNTQNVTNMSDMFEDCHNLKSLDLSNFNTDKVTDMYDMFYKCKSLETLDISKFNTQKVENMSDLFNNCSSLKSLDISKFNTENVTNMEDMFKNCSSLISLDLSNFNTQNVDDTNDMFNGCSALNKIVLSDKINTEISDQILPTASTADTKVWVKDGGDAAGTESIPSTDGIFADAGTYRAAGTFFTLSFDANGGIGTAEDMIVSYNVAIDTLPAVTNEGYAATWTIDTDTITAETIWTYTENKQAVLQWTAINYTITYNLDGGTNNEDNPDTYTVESETITLADASKDDYTFEGWYSDAEFENMVTEIAASSTGNKELWAKWEITLAYAKELKKATVDTLANSVTESDYTAESWAVFQAAITADKDAIDDCTTVEDVNAYELTAKVEDLVTVASVADAFKTEHATALALTTETVAMTDSTMVNEALAAYEALATEVQTALAAEKTLLDNLSTKIAELETAAGISDAQAPAPFTRVQNTLYFAQPTDMAVYSVSGAMLYNGTVTEYTLPNTIGVYIIRTNVGAYKVVNN